MIGSALHLSFWPAAPRYGFGQKAYPRALPSSGRRAVGSCACHIERNSEMKPFTRVGSSLHLLQAAPAPAASAGCPVQSTTYLVLVLTAVCSAAIPIRLSTYQKADWDRSHGVLSKSWPEARETLAPPLATPIWGLRIDPIETQM